MKKLFVDTNIIVDYMKKRDTLLMNLVVSQDKKLTELYINPVIITEYFADRNLKEHIKKQKTIVFFRYFNIIDITSEIGYLAADLMRENCTPFIADALNAATCLLSNFELVTRNIKHFKNVPGLKLYKL